MEIIIEDLIFSFDLKIQIGRQCVLLMPIKLTEYEISRLYKMAFGKEIEHPEDLSEKEGDLLEDYICIYISRCLNNREIINQYISNWLSAGEVLAGTA